MEFTLTSMLNVLMYFDIDKYVKFTNNILNKVYYNKFFKYIFFFWKCYGKTTDVKIDNTY